jgi:SH3-like domain-containing protein
MSIHTADPSGAAAPQKDLGVVLQQLRALWRRFQSHALSKRLIFVAVPVVVAGLVVVGAALLVNRGEESPAPPPRAPAAGPTPVPTGAAAVVEAAPGPRADDEPSELSEAAPEPGSPSDTAPVLAAAPPSGPPRVRVVGTDGQGANMRREPYAASPRVTVIREGVELDVIGPDRRVEGETWRNVQDEDGEAGWIAGQFLTEVRTSGPRPTPTPRPLTIQVADIASAVGRGQEAFLVINTRPGVRCELRVFLFGPTYLPREGLEPKVADAKGECGWSWTVPEETVPGTWRYMIIVGTGEQQVTREISFAVI